MIEPKGTKVFGTKRAAVSDSLLGVRADGCDRYGRVLPPESTSRMRCDQNFARCADSAASDRSGQEAQTRRAIWRFDASATHLSPDCEGGEAATEAVLLQCSSVLLCSVEERN